MLKAIVATTLILLALDPRAHAAPAKRLTGVIVKFECGDNCYLTIRTKSGETTSLCEAKPCVPWFENQSMPKTFIGRTVTVTTGIGKQVDGNYSVVGHTTSFRTLEFAK